MSEHPYCSEHKSNTLLLQDISKSLALQQKDIEYLRRDQDVILARFLAHMNEAERQGGWHDRMKQVEADIIAQAKDLATFRKFQLLYSGIGGLIGGIVGSKSPELIIGFFKNLGA